MPEQDGPFKIQTCSVCHIHGNRDRSHCDKEPCSSWTSCGRKESHKHEVARAKKDIQKEIRELNLIIGDMRTEMEKMDGFEQRTQTSFMHIMKSRLKALDTVKYSMSTNLPVEQQTRKNSNFPVRGIFKNPREIIVNIFR